MQSDYSCKDENLFSKLRKLSNNDSSTSLNLSNIKFPMDNSEFNFMIIDANLGISENLQNIFFLEFDLAKSSTNKEKLKFLRDISNECVDREIFFSLNVI